MMKWMRIAALAVLPLCLACTSDDSGPDPDPAEEVDFIRLQIGDQTVDVSPTNVSVTVDIPRGSTPISATFRRSTGTTIALTGTEGFELQVATANQDRLTFERTGVFAGTLHAAVSGVTTFTVTLVHDNHTDFGPRTVTVNVLPLVDV